VSDFSGKSLNASFGSQFYLNHNCAEAQALKVCFRVDLVRVTRTRLAWLISPRAPLAPQAWWVTQGSAAKLESISNQRREGGGGGDQRVTFAEIAAKVRAAVCRKRFCFVVGASPAKKYPTPPAHSTTLRTIPTGPGSDEDRLLYRARHRHLLRGQV
jgi:hypothetical protein